MQKASLSKVASHFECPLQRSLRLRINIQGISGINIQGISRLLKMMIISSQELVLFASILCIACQLHLMITYRVRIFLQWRLYDRINVSKIINALNISIIIYSIKELRQL